MANAISVEAAGLVYRNPKPELRTIVAYHPSLMVMGENELLTTFDLGQTVEALDYHTVVGRSLDGGKTWSVEGPIIKDPPPNTTHSIRTTRLANGSLVGFGGLHHRRGPDDGLVNRATFGFVPVSLILVRSTDGGRSWTAPKKLEPALASASWEVCHPIVELNNGRWLAPTATWRGWNGENPAGEQGVVLISNDQGATWPAYGRTFDGRSTGVCHFEQSVVQLQDGRVLSVAWLYDPKSGKNLPNEFSISNDRGETFCQPQPTGFLAQTCKLIQLQDGRLLCAYRRNDRPGLWANLVRIEGTKWINLVEAPLWQGAESGMAGRASGGDELSALKFGYPSMKQLSSGEVFLLFWCQEDCITNVRWLRLSVS